LTAFGASWVTTQKDITRIDATQCEAQKQISRMQEIVDTQNKMLNESLKTQAVTAERLANLTTNVSQIYELLSSKMVIYQKPVRRVQNADDSN
jgi:hypothetical protein